MTESSGSAGASAALGTTARSSVGAPPATPGSPTRASRHRTRSRRRRRVDRGPRPAPRLPAPSARRASSGGSASSVSRSANGPPGVPRTAAGPSTTSPTRSPALPKAPRCSAIPPARITVRSGRRPATAETTAASSPSQRRSSAAGGSPEPTRTADTSWSRSIVDIASWSFDSELVETTRQPLRDAVATSGASARSEAATTARRRGAWLATSSRGRSVASPTRRSRAAASRLLRGDGTIPQGRDDGLDIGAGRHRQRTDETPAAADPTDHRGGDRGGARVEGDEGSGLARHGCMLPGSVADRFGRPGRTRPAGIKRPRRSPRPSPRDGR